MKKFIKTFLSIALIISSMSSMTVFADEITTNSAVSPWAEGEYSNASVNGLLTYDFVRENLKETVTRKEFEDLLLTLREALSVKEQNEEDVSLDDSKKPVTNTLKNENKKLSQTQKESKVENTTTVQKKENVQMLENLHSSSLVTTKNEENKDKEFFKVSELTREEMIAMLIEELVLLSKTLEIPEDTGLLDYYEDGKDVGNEYKSSFATALKNDLISGLSEGDEIVLLKPQSKATREQAITLINRSFDLVKKSRKYQIMLPFTIEDNEDKKLSINFEVSESGDIALVEVDGAEYYSLIVKDKNNEIFYEKNFKRIKDISIEKDLEKDETYTVIIGVKFKDDEEQYSLPISFEYKGDYIIGEKIVQEVKKYLGVNYVWGGTTPRGFDCSGLTQYVCNTLGIKIMRVADDQWKASGTYVSRNELQPGDLVYFGSGNHATHTGVYVGDGQMIHAPHTGDVVRYASIDNSYFASRFLGGKRVY